MWPAANTTGTTVTVGTPGAAVAAAAAVVAAAVVAAAVVAAAAEAIDRCVWLHTRIRSSAALSRWVFSVPLSPRSTTGFPSAEVVAVGQGGQLGGLDSHDRIDVELRKSFEARESRSGDAAGAATLGPRSRPARHL